jgi:hypothetical protein
MDSMDNNQAQNLKDLNEGLNQPFMASVAGPSYPQHQVNYTQYPANYIQYPPNYTPVPEIAHTHAQRFTNEGVSQPYGGRVATHERPSQPFGSVATMPARPLLLDYTQEFFHERPSQPFVASVAGPNISQYQGNYTGYPVDYAYFPFNYNHAQAKRFTNERASQPYGGRVATDERVSQPFGATATMPARPQPSVNYTQASVDERLVQPYVPSVAGPLYPGYMYPTHDHQRRIDAALEMYKTPARQYTQMPISERVYVDTPQWSYTTRTKRPIVKLPVAEVTETTNVQQLTDTTSSDSEDKSDHETCVKMADLAIKTWDHPPDPTDLSDAEAKLHSQVEQILGVLTRMDRTIHKFMPDKSVYVRYNLDQVEEKLAGLRERIVKQETLDPREIARVALYGEYVAPVYELFFVDSEEGLKEMLRVIEACIVVSESSRPSEPTLSVDTEGEIALLQILVHAAKAVYIIDFTNLGDLVFATSISAEESTETSLKTIFESPSILKLFWDVRGNSAMFHKFHGVILKCVLDVQLMDLVTRRGYKGSKGRSKKKILRDHKTVKAMGQAFHERCTEIPLEVRREWLSTKDFGKLAMGPTGYELTQRFYDASGGVYPIAIEMMAKEGITAASGGSGSDSEGTSTSVSASTFTSTSHSTPAKEPKDAVFLFDIRPLPQLLETYASNDVTALPVLYLHHSKHATWNKEVEDHVWLHSEKRLQEAREPGSGVRLKGKENLAPEGWFEPEWLKETTK